MTKRIIRKSKTEHEYGLYISKEDDRVFINSWSIPIEDWPKVAAWVLQTVATLKIEEREYEFTHPLSAGEMDRLLIDQLSKTALDMFKRDDAFFIHMKSKRKSK